jgi:hypothetical protein
MTDFLAQAKELAAKISLLGKEAYELGRLKDAEQDLTARRRLSLAERAKWEEQDAAETKIAKLFGKSRGWKLTDRDFGWRTLACRSPRRCLEWERPPGCDHDWFYNLNGRAIAIATHPYDLDREECEAFARKFHLGFELPDWPSWHLPGRTIFALWTAPAEPLSREQLQEIIHDGKVAKGGVTRRAMAMR